MKRNNRIKNIIRMVSLMLLCALLPVQATFAQGPIGQTPFAQTGALGLISAPTLNPSAPTAAPETPANDVGQEGQTASFETPAENTAGETGSQEVPSVPQTPTAAPETPEGSGENAAPAETENPEATENPEGTTNPEGTEFPEGSENPQNPEGAEAGMPAADPNARTQALMEKVAASDGHTRWDDAEAERLASREGTIPEHVSIEGISVAGQTASEADAVVQQYVDGFSGVTFTLGAEDRQITAMAWDVGLAARNADVVNQALRYGQDGQLLERFTILQDRSKGVEKDFQISLTSTNSNILAFLEAHAQELNRAPVEYELVRQDGAFQVLGGDPGLAVDVGKSMTAVADYINSEWDGTDAYIPLVVQVTYPNGDRESLAAVQDLLGTYTTNFSAGANGRNQNIRAATTLVNGTILFPGEVFSAYQTMSPMDEAHGYTNAGGYENGQVVDVIGGGVCQVSTTLYNAVIRAELEVVTRSSHSMMVDYVKPSEDAAIAGDYKDFQFRNNTDYPVYIEGWAGSGSVSFNVYGKETRPANRSVSFQSEVVSQDDYEVKYVTSDAYDAGSVQRTQSAHTGYVARLWKIVKENGVEVDRFVYNNSRYQRTDAIITIGTAGMSSEGRNAIAEAIASGSDATIRNTAAQYTASAEAYRQQQREAQAAAEAQAAQQAAEQAASQSTGTDASTGGTTDSSSAGSTTDSSSAGSTATDSSASSTATE